MTVCAFAIGLFLLTRVLAAPIDVNRRFLANHGPMAEASTLASFQSSQCRNFYVDPDDRWGKLRNTLALEDLHKGGRLVAFSQGFMHQEIVVSLRWKFVYTVVRKSASTAILGALQRLFGANRSWCADRCREVGACAGTHAAVGRCTTLALNNSELQNFFFFSFVRNPTDRWFSQYAQAHVAWRSTKSVPSMEKARSTLLEMGVHAFVTEHHLQTQTHSLTSTTHLGLTTPMHFIGRVETLEADWAYVVREIWRRNGVVDFANRTVEPLQQVGHHEQNRDQFVDKLNSFKSNQSLLTLIREVYTQDYACFGYSQ
jgi:hypothetical protein